jgi:hypothetical protein
VTYLDYSGKVLRNASNLERGINGIEIHGRGDEHRTEDCDQPNLGHSWESSTPNELDGDIYEYCVGDRVCCNLFCKYSKV